MTPTPISNKSYWLFGGVLALLLWAYGNTLLNMASKWWTDPQYSQGYLIPLIALILLYLRRDALQKAVSTPDPRGLLLLVVGLGLHVLSGRLYIDFIDGMSFLPSLAGLVWIFGGWPLLRAAGPPLLFLAFMVPLPFSVEATVSLPLQQVATLGSTLLLQTLGFPAIAEGNVIVMTHTRIGVVEACSGLSMLLVIFALMTAFALIARPSWFDCVLLIASALPLGVFVNVLRITATGIAQESWGLEVAEDIVHDWAGWLMMPILCALIAVEVWLFRFLFPTRSTHAYEEERSRGYWEDEAPDQSSRPPQAWWRDGLLAGSAALTVVAGLWNGMLTERWGDSPELTLAIQRVQQVKTTIGDWTSQPLNVDLRALELSEVSGHISRIYINRKTGEQVNVLLVCGRSGPVSVHTPDICYQRNGYQMGPRSRYDFQETTATHEFWSAYFNKQRDPIPLHIIWSWSDGESWKVPNYPRLSYLGSKVLFKLYLIRQERTIPPPLTDETFERFLSELLPELRQTLFPAE